MSKYLMVPVRLDALFVNDDELTVVSSNADFSKLPYLDRIAKEEINSRIPNISEEIVSHPFKNENLPLEHGIHLHWALPDALTRGDSGLNFPVVPNRWLVTRRCKNDDKNKYFKQWVVESDYLFPPGINKHGTSVSIPYSSTNWQKGKDGKGVYEYTPGKYQYDKLKLPDVLQKNKELLERFFIENNNLLTLKEKDLKSPDILYQGIKISSEDKLQFEYFLRHPEGRADQPFRYMGRKMPAEAWKENFENTEYYPNLTAVGYGDPTFAAFYPNCFSVFGLHDDIEKEIQFTDLQYEIVGWYSNEKNDVITEFTKNLAAHYTKDKDDRTASAINKAVNTAIQEKFSWKIDPIDSTPPDRMLCYSGLMFDASAVTEDENKWDENVCITVANTPTEALSACLAKKIADEKNNQSLRKIIEDQLEATQLSYRLDQKKLDTVSRFNQFRHENGFMPIDSGHLWVIHKETKSSSQKDTALTQSDASDITEENAFALLPADIADKLDAVNSLQRRYDAANQEIEAMRMQLFADWYKYMLCVYPVESGSNDHPDPDLVKFFIETKIIPPLNEKIMAAGNLDLSAIKDGNLNDISATYDSHEKSLAVQLAGRVVNVGDGKKERAAGKIQELHASIKSAEESINTNNKEQARRFALNQRIVDCFSSDIKNDILKHLSSISGKSVTLNKKDFSEMITAIIGQEKFKAYEKTILEAAEDKNSEAPYTIVSFNLERIPAPRFWQPANPVVLIEGNVVTPTKRHGQDGELYCPIFDSNGKVLSDNLFNAITNEIHNMHIKANGDFGFNTWKCQPWNPFMLEWQVDFFPTGDGSNVHASTGTYSQAFITNNYYTAPPYPDLLMRTDKAGIVKAGLSYSGESILTPQAGSLLMGAIERELIDRLKVFSDKNKISLDPSSYEKEDAFKNPVCTLVYTYSKLAELKTLSQSLNGFNKALLMYKQTMELPVEDPLGFHTYRFFTDQLVHQAMGQSIKAAPSPLNAFNPIRSGCLKIQHLCLVDTFGQTRNLSTKKINTTYSQTVPLNPYMVHLPPRLSQPARLNFRWLNASDKKDQQTNSHVSTTPICGWLLSNKFDSSLMFYDASGKALGYFRGDNWHEAIDSDAAVEIQHIPNPHLKKVAEFVESNIKKNKTFLDHFIASIDGALDRIHPEKNTEMQSPSLLIGRPVAVVRASLNLELCGSSAINMSWDALRKDLASPARTDDNFPMVKFPVRLGEFEQLNDGLVGYWLENESGDINCIRVTESILKTLVDTNLKSILKDDAIKNLTDKLINRIYANTADFQNSVKKIGIKYQMKEVVKTLKGQGAEALGEINRVLDISLLEYLYTLVNNVDDGNFTFLENELNSIADNVNVLKGKLQSSNLSSALKENISKLISDGGDVYRIFQTIIGILHAPLLQQSNNTPDFTTAIYYAPQNKYLSGKKAENQFIYECFEDDFFNFSQSIADRPQNVTMLMDVQGSIRATIGIVPCKEISIPPDHYVNALKNIEVTFQHAPLLTRQTKIDIAVRPIHQHSWSWVERCKPEKKDKQENGLYYWAEFFPESRIERSVFIEQWKNVSDKIPGDMVWEYLLSKDVGWLSAEDGSTAHSSDYAKKITKAIVVERKDRKAAFLKSSTNNPNTYTIEGMEAQVDDILERFSKGVVPMVTNAVFTGQQEIREGWLKLRTVNRQDADKNV